MAVIGRRATSARPGCGQGCGLRLGSRIAAASSRFRPQFMRKSHAVASQRIGLRAGWCGWCRLVKAVHQQRALWLGVERQDAVRGSARSARPGQVHCVRESSPAHRARASFFARGMHRCCCRDVVAPSETPPLSCIVLQRPASSTTHCGRHPDGAGNLPHGANGLSACPPLTSPMAAISACSSSRRIMAATAVYWIANVFSTRVVPMQL
ncbi:hypothetical protein EJ04DRAFT_27727 [Polyplosphaeria fusca]|uniref:Uncharacterized protein n=1 Tax=Polyplosphaeria fusca TaxID=682080 RepID=A0A9P4V705_9PLEO|nr:hypothetical protein EJ04DRAFT_27727 [Polyplosphaeria fusca]